MASAPSSRRLMRLHLALLVCVSLCASAFAVEVMRALGGNPLSWAYVFEWPILLAYGVYLWQRLVREERGRDAPAEPLAPLVAPALDEDEEAREAWNAYLARLHAEDAAAGRAARRPPSAGSPA